MRVVVPVLISFILFGCGSTQESQVAAKTVRRAKITQFYAADPMIPKGLTGKLCYGVENATRLDLNPPSQDVWPSMARCFEVSPKQKTTYTLTAYGEDGSTDVKTVDVKVGGEPPRLYDLWVNSLQVHPGELVRVCFKTENVTSVKASPGKLAQGLNCVNDNPSKTTTYKIIAYGSDRQEDTGTVTVKVR
jgi:hypothetical protein